MYTLDNTQAVHLLRTSVASDLANGRTAVARPLFCNGVQHRAKRTPHLPVSLLYNELDVVGGSVAEWLACWTQAQKAQVQIAVATLSGNSLRQTAHTHCASVH